MTHHHRLAVTRARFTGESTDEARRGVSRSGDHGLDTCSPEQLELRALLLHFTFQPGAWNISRAMFYTWNASPRYDEFVVANADAPDNLAASLLPVHGVDCQGLPGLRLLPRTRRGNNDCVHLPTGARLRIASERGWLREHHDPVQRPLSPGESRALEDAAPMSQDTKQLFASLLARCSGRASDDSWELGQFFFAHDAAWNDGHCANLTDFELSGAENSWKLTWRGPMMPETIARALTMPRNRIARRESDGSRAWLGQHHQIRGGRFAAET